MRYTIPTTLDKSRLDVSINLKTSDGTPIRHFNLSVLLYTLVTVFICFKIVNIESIAVASTFHKFIIFISILYTALVWRLITDITNRPLYMYAPYLMDSYKNKIKNDDAYSDIIALHSVVDENVVKLTNGRLSMILNVTGRCSNVMTNTEINNSVESYDIFYRNIKSISSNIIIETFTKIQQVDTTKQLEYTENMKYPPACDRFMRLRQNQLKNNTDGILFNQYMVIIADSMNDLSDVLGAIPADIFSYIIEPADNYENIMSDLLFHIGDAD